MIIVTGGAGFIGSHLIKALNNRGELKIIVVDDLTNGHQFQNLVECQIIDYVDKEDFLKQILTNDLRWKSIKAIFHEGACTDTTEWNGKFMMSNNYGYSKVLLHHCLNHHIPFIYASSAAVYGKNSQFQEDDVQSPLNIYGYSKYLLDQYIRPLLPSAKSQVVGLRYFNVYGPQESHKGKMASVIQHFNRQLKETGGMKLFQGTENYANGEQARDFVYVKDIAAINLWFYEHPSISGIFNAGTGQARTFNDVAKIILQWHKNQGKIEYIPFPETLRPYYQNFTQANLTQLRKAGYNLSFTPLETGIDQYLNEIE
jgi:ADP-L-glycero-D-manno-heptose 6-epimerase